MVMVEVMVAWCFPGFYGLVGTSNFHQFLTSHKILNHQLNKSNYTNSLQFIMAYRHMFDSYIAVL
jgi:hypothetical protein